MTYYPDWTAEQLRDLTDEQLHDEVIRAGRGVDKHQGYLILAELRRRQRGGQPGWGPGRRNLNRVYRKKITADQEKPPQGTPAAASRKPC